MQAALTVSEFVAAAKEKLEREAAGVWVAGEVANFTCAASGHWYFSLRDGAARLDCVMLARQNRLADGTPANGDDITVFGSAALYAPQARFQLAVRFLRFAGAGRLHQLFLQRKQQWRARGWFDRQQPLPALPQTVGVVCSSAGAALQDVLYTLKMRFPLLRVVIYPAPAQGAEAADKIAAMINLASQRRDCQVLLVVRGGGSWEDLWAYNEEAVVAAIYGCALPVVSGIGHETDDTLADYAADKRCPTPTAAAAAAVPAAAALCQRLAETERQLGSRLQAAVDGGSQRLDWAQRLLAAPRRLLEKKGDGWRRQQQALQVVARQQLAQRQQRLEVAAARLPLPTVRAAAGALAAGDKRLILAAKGRLAMLAARLARGEDALGLLSPEKLLRRGYSIVSDAAGKVVSRVRQVQAAEVLTIRVSDGTVRAKPLSKAIDK